MVIDSYQAYRITLLHWETNLAIHLHFFGAHRGYLRVRDHTEFEFVSLGFNANLLLKDDKIIVTTTITKPLPYIKHCSRQFIDELVPLLPQPFFFSWCYYFPHLPYEKTEAQIN